MWRTILFNPNRSLCYKFLVLAYFFISVCRLFAQSVPENPEIHEFAGPMRFLSSEMLRGRETGTESAGIAAGYLAACLQSYGLQPAGDKTSGERSFFQKFNIISYKTDSDSLIFTLGENQLKLSDSPDFSAVIGTLEAVNVLAMIPGRDTGRSIIVGAHYDHLGQRGDSIYFGADDNASGTAGVLTMAKNWAESGFIPSCNLVFAFWSAEEKGMLGSTFYVINNQLDTSNTAVYLNFDMISRKDVTDSTQISIGLLTGTNEIEKMAIEENAKLPQPFRLDLWHTSGDGGSDYVAFAKKGIPLMTFFSGFSNDYHTPGDIFETTDLFRMKTILQLANQCLIRLADQEK
jgi:hypothetical protein